MMEALPAAIYMTDAEGRLTYFNAAAVKLSGRTPELNTDKWCITWKTFLPDGTSLPDDQCPMAITLRGGDVPTGIECIAERPDGSRYWFSPCPATLRDAEGRIVGGINLLIDITARKKAEIKAHEQFRAIIETTPEFVKIIAPDGTLLFMNSPGVEMVGASSADAVTGKSIFEIIAPEDRDRFHKFHDGICQGQKGSIQFEIVGLNGARRHLEAHAAPLRHVDGTIVHLAITHDITERKHAERAALLLSAIVDSSDDAIISKDLDGVITSWNKSAERLFGYTAAEAIGHTVSDLLIPEDRQHEESDILKRLRRGERVDPFETVRRRKDGSRLDISLTISPVRNAAGVIIGASKIARDISERKHIDHAALLLSAIVDSSDDAIISKDLNGVITSWNKSAERLFGYTAAEAIGKTVASLLIPEDRQNEEPDILARLRKGERVDHFETVRQRKDGSRLDISLTISPVRDARGAIIGASKIARDVSESKRVRAALMESEARFRQLADTMPQIVWTARPDGYIDYYNQRWYAFTGFSHDVVGDASWEAILHPDDLQRTRESYYAAIHSGQPYNIEYRLMDRSLNVWRWFIARAVAVHDAEGKIVKWFGTCTDIDEQKRAQDDLRRANEDLEQFAFSASHDLQEPMRGIKIYSELLSKRYGSQLDGEALRFLGYLRNGATRMECLVRDLLTYTKVTTLEQETEIADANEALKSSLANLSGAVSESGANVTTGPLPSLPVNHTHLQQLFQNIIGNAIKYRSPDRPPVVRVAAERRHGCWIFSISDNGIGIDSEYKENIFGLFKRLHNSDEYSGTGIGLAICKRLVDRYHGRIWVESEPGRGSTFRFTLPV
jgi:PAS domain S-box-containing protein